MVKRMCHCHHRSLGAMDIPFIQPILNGAWMELRPRRCLLDELEGNAAG